MTERKFTRNLKSKGMAQQLRESVSKVIHQDLINVCDCFCFSSSISTFQSWPNRFFLSSAGWIVKSRREKSERSLKIWSFLGNFESKKIKSKFFFWACPTKRNFLIRNKVEEEKQSQAMTRWFYGRKKSVFIGEYCNWRHENFFLVINSWNLWLNF